MQKIYTERAHLMCPNMFFGIVISIHAAFAASRCGYESKVAQFIGSLFFGFAESRGYSITNLGKYDSDNIEEAAFLPPASPAIKKTLGVLTVNGKMFVCSAVR